MMVWGVSPQRRTVTVYHSAADVRLLTEKEELSGEDVVPGYRGAVREILETV
jgi:hypothetical protein